MKKNQQKVPNMHKNIPKKTNRTISRPNKENLTLNSSYVQNGSNIYCPSMSKKKQSSLNFTHNTINLVISQQKQTLTQSLLDTLLYGENEADQNNLQSIYLEQEEDELLLGGQEFYQQKRSPNQQNCITPLSKIHSQIESIEEQPNLQSKTLQTVKEKNLKNTDSRFKVERKQLKFEDTKKEKQQLKFWNKQNKIIMRLQQYLPQHPKQIFCLFKLVYLSQNQAQLMKQVRNFLFQHNIIFNHNNLQSFLQTFDLKDRCSIGNKLESMFLADQAHNANQIKDLQLDILESQQKISIWKVLSDILDNIQMEESIKKYQKNTEIIVEWLSSLLWEEKQSSTTIRIKMEIK